MTREAARFLEKARKLFAQAETMLGIGLNDAAGRTAYLAGFHVAQAFLFERLGNPLKTHSGVQTEFPAPKQKSHRRARPRQSPPAVGNLVAIETP